MFQIVPKVHTATVTIVSDRDSDRPSRAIVEVAEEALNQNGLLYPEAKEILVGAVYVHDKGAWKLTVQVPAFPNGEVRWDIWWALWKPLADIPQLSP